MTEVLHHSSSPSSSSPSISTPTTHNGTLYVEEIVGSEVAVCDSEEEIGGEEEEEEGVGEKGRRNQERDHLSLLALLVTLFRKSFWLACKTNRGGGGGGSGMEIGWPTNVRHVAHVTFDRFNGFLGLPVEFEPEVSRRAPSASTTVFGVSTESMQLSFDSRGNSVPTILLLMQRRLYTQGGLRAEGIFRINAENSEEELVREQLNRGIVPDGIDVHCLAGLIKAWFRELPSGVLDSLSPEQVMQCQSEEDCSTLVRLLPPTEAALLDWAINLMADVVLEEHLNKMNSRNIAMVFAPNMTQMADPLTALMYAVQVMNFLRTLIEKTLKDREDSLVEPDSVSNLDRPDEYGHQSPPQFSLENSKESHELTEQVYTVEEPDSASVSESNRVDNITDDEYLSYTTSSEESDDTASCETPIHVNTKARKARVTKSSNLEEDTQKMGQSSDSNQTKDVLKIDLEPTAVQSLGNDSKSKGMSNLCRINSITGRTEAWR
ncbi:Rho GTPase-activating protein 1 [Capsicum chinense]|uniref:rho GTPase-activating protein 5 n=1 Tax=Capsicum annuum TaxID=4072 RepID=UPI0007BF1CBB|nr:rho GTPase-activating protein 5 [Capsicum annuum]KAF3643114.1 Rho GTPase-activating protein 1 [Capsicum annuum]PHU03668.1 Rho GTPase-activating protein 1 [Capsicum chinense]